MARDNILLTYVGLDILFVSTGALLIVFALNNQAESAKEFTKDTVVRDLLLGMCPLNGNNPLLPVPHHAPSHHEQNTDLEKCIAAIGNAVLVFVTFLISIPAIVMPSTRGWLKFHGYLTVICAFFTLVIGLDIWFETLKTRKNLSDIWITQPPATQSLLQQTVCLPHPLFFPPTLLYPSISLLFPKIQTLTHPPTAPMLRLLQQHLPPLRPRHLLHIRHPSRLATRLRNALLAGSQQLPRPSLHGRFWNRGTRCCAGYHDGDSAQGPQGEGAVSVY